MTLGEKIVLWCIMVAGLLLVASSALADNAQLDPPVGALQCVGGSNTWKNDSDCVTFPAGTVPSSITVKQGQGCYPVYPENTVWDECYKDPVRTGNTWCVETKPGVSGCGISHLEGYYTTECVPTHSPPTCTAQTCGQSLPWKDSCDNDEEPIVCDPCGCTLPDIPKPECKCGETIEWRIDCENKSEYCGDCPCVPDPPPVCGENDCGKTLEYIDSCSHEKKYVVCEECECVPQTECAPGFCGNAPDGCGGVIHCGNCPPPPPPPGNWPTPECGICDFSNIIRLHTSRDVVLANGVLIPCQTEYIILNKENVVLQLVIDADEDSEYIVWSGDFNDPSKRRTRVFSFTGPGTVTVPYPAAGYPIQQYTDLWMSGGAGTVDVFLRDKWQHAAGWLVMGSVCEGY